MAAITNPAASGSSGSANVDLLKQVLAQSQNQAQSSMATGQPTTFEDIAAMQARLRKAQQQPTAQGQPPAALGAQPLTTFQQYGVKV